MKKICVSFFLLTFIVQSSFAQSYSNAVGKAVGGLIAAKSSSRVSGIAMDSLAPAAMSYQISQQVQEPAYQKTVDVASMAITGILTAAIAAGTSPVWVVALAGTAAAVAVPLALNSAVKWLVNSNGTVTVGSGGSAPLPEGAVALNAGDNTWNSSSYYDGSVHYFHGADQMTVILAVAERNAALYDGGKGYKISGCYGLVQGSDRAGCTVFFNVPQPPNYFGATDASAYLGDGYGGKSLSPISCPAGTVNANGACSSQVVDPAHPSIPAPSPVSMAAAISQLSDADKLQPVNPQVVADIVNKIWSQSSVTSAGLPPTIPFDPSSPVTAADVSAYMAASATPLTVGDVVQSGINPATGSASIPIPGAVNATHTGAVTGTSTTTATATGTKSSSIFSIDWGSFIAPELAVPSIESILDPIFNMFPTWSHMTFNAHESACPRPSVQLPSSILGGRVIVFNELCDWVETVKIPLQYAFTLGWAIAIMLIILGA